MFKNSTISILFFFFPTIALAQSAPILDAASRYPSDTTVFIFCHDLNQLLKQMKETSVFKACMTSDLPGEIAAYRNEFELLRSQKHHHMIFPDDADIAVAVSGIFDGRMELAVLPIDDKRHWSLKIGLIENNATLKAIAKELSTQKELGNLTYKPFKDLARWERLSHPQADGKDHEGEQPPLFGEFEIKPFEGFPGGQFFAAWTSNEITASSSPDVLFSLLANNGPTETDKKKNLAKNRKFIELMFHLDAEHFHSADLLFYVDSSESIDNFLSGKAIDQKQIKALRAMGIGEFLSYGGKICLADPKFEFQVDLYAGVSLPNAGILNILELKPLASPVRPGVPIDVDYYFSTNVNMPLFQTTTKQIRESGLGIRACMEIQDYVLHNYLKLIIGYWTACPVSEASVANCTGDIDVFGTSFDHGFVQASRSVTRTFLQTGSSIIDDFLATMPSAKTSLVKAGIGSQIYYHLSEAEVQKNAARYANQYPDAAKIFNSISALAEVDSDGGKYFGVFSSDDDFRRIHGGVFETLDRDSNVQLLWNELAKKENPGCFAFGRADTFFSPVFYQISGRAYGYKLWLDSTLNEKSHGIERQRKLANSDFEYRMNVRRGESFDKWTRSKFKSNFKCGAIGVYKEPKGYLVRVLQLR